MRDLQLDADIDKTEICSPNLLDVYMKDLEKAVKEDEVTKRVVFLTGVSSYTRDPLNLFLKGPSSIGKTYVTVETIKYFPEDRVMLLGGLSPTALVHDFGVLKDKDGREFTLLDAPNKDYMREDFKSEDGRINHRALNEEYALRRTEWDKKIRDSYNEVKLGGRILVFLESPHEDTFMRLRPILSHDAPEIEFKFTGKEGSGQLRTMKVKLVGWPATIFCTTETKYLEELATRSLTHTPDMSVEKYRKAVQLLGHRASFPLFYEKERESKTALKEFFSKILPTHGINVEPPRIVIPYYDSLSNFIDVSQPRDQRDWQKMKSLIESSTLLHCFHRPVVMMGMHTHLVANFMDLGNAASVFSKVEESTRLGLSGHIIKVFYDVIVKRWNKDGKAMRVQDLVSDHNTLGHGTINRKTFYKYLNALEDRAWVMTEADPTDRRKKMVIVTKGSTESRLLSSLRQFQSHFTLQSLKEWITTYIDLFTQVSGIMDPKVTMAEDMMTPIENWRLFYDPKKTEYVEWTQDQHTLFDEVLGRLFFEGLDLTLLQAGLKAVPEIGMGTNRDKFSEDQGELTEALKMVLTVLKDSVKQNDMNPVERIDLVETLIQTFGYSPAECHKLIGILLKDIMIYERPGDTLYPTGGIFG